MIGHEIIGSGPNRVIVLHGWFGDHGVWSQTYPMLDKSQFTYAFVDYRGYGSSRAISGPHTMAQISKDTIELADGLGWKKFSLVGHSMGGMAAQRVAIDAPDRVESLVAVTPVPATGVPLPTEVLAVFEAAATNDQAAAGVIETSLGNRLSPAFTQMVLSHKKRTVDSAVFSDYLKAFTATNFADQASKLKAPILVLYGQHDGGVSEALVKDIFPKLYPHAKLEALPNAGHYPMLETPAHLVTVAERFMAANAR